ncbi:putative enzyme [Rubrivivax sp. A210]|uniref:SET domain-containing protein n=1 Tax=Rubrivivax sp. A210 TaxID=2772301 RepID=UPI00191854E6|nr:SET domain-containing protein-lysine N-methyltransferase [Rubrivivax sp. A210]CAD5371811.1 putative enzyme [Rubrivivax sp. A210]
MSKTAQAAARRPSAASDTPAPAARADNRRVQVRRSGIHGKGLFVLQPIAEGERILEYKGETITWRQAQKRHPHDPAQPNHTFFFHLDDKHVIDGGVGGNASRWINHACTPNCVAEEVDRRIFIHAARNLEVGEEIFYDYSLVIDERYTAALKKEYACHCGAADCRGTMLAAKRPRAKKSK